MKVIVSGSRHIRDYDLLLAAIRESGFRPSVIVHGDATGADKLGSRFARENSIAELKFPANWNEHGKAAGPIRNSEMIKFVSADLPDAGLIALWDGKSRGTWDCIKKAYAAGFRIYVKCPSAVTTAQ